MKPICLPCLSLLAALTGCVSTGTYDAAVADATKARAREASVAHELAGARSGLSTCRTELDGMTALNEGLRAELQRRGQDADALLSAKGELASSLEQTRARLEELRKAQAAAEARAQLFRSLALKLKSMVDAGDLQILVRSGRMVLVLPNDVLFDSGKAVIKPRGKETLAQIAAVLRTVPGRRFQVAGHTDNEPIRVSGYTSNWDLSANRALEVIGYLIQSGMLPGALSAAGYGEFDPIAGNDLPDGKAKNRRIEITLQPNIDELVAIPTGR